MKKLKNLVPAEPLSWLVIKMKCEATIMITANLWMNDYIEIIVEQNLNLLWFSTWPQLTGTSQFHVMACHLLGAKPLATPEMIYCQLDSHEQI